MRIARVLLLFSQNTQKQGESYFETSEQWFYLTYEGIMFMVVLTQKSSYNWEKLYAKVRIYAISLRYE